MSSASVDLSPVYGNVLVIRADNCADRHGGVDRRSRASAISAAKRAYERANGVRLTLKSKRYDEDWGFLHRSEFQYTVTRLQADGSYAGALWRSFRT